MQNKHTNTQLTDIDDAMVRQLPAGLQPQYAQAVTLLRREVAEGRVRDVIRLKCPTGWWHEP